MPEVNICNMQEKFQVDQELEMLIKEIIEVALAHEKVGDNAEVSIVLADNDYIQALNKKYRFVDSPTDVLSFAMNEKVCEQDIVEYNDQEQLLGDIVISLERAKQQAEEYGHSLKREIGYLSVHGLLHLLGYNHETEEEKEIMRTKEEDILKMFNLTRGAY